ncbi:MAG: BamA/TamA family outer membrane protein [Bacteroidota bacterium]
MVAFEIMWTNVCAARSTKLSLFVLAVLTLGSCSSSKEFSKDASPLRKVTYTIITDDDRVSVKNIRKELNDQVQQLPQRKSALNPRTWGKPLVIYDEEKTVESADRFQQYLHNRKGFYDAKVSFETDLRGNGAYVNYLIELGQRHYVKSVTMNSDDRRLLELFESNQDKSILGEGVPLDSRLFDREQARLINLAKDNGYADFAGNYIEYKGDSSNYEVDVTISIYPPYPLPKHTRYTVGDVNVYTEHVASSTPTSRRIDTVNQRFFHAKSDGFIVDPGTISSVIPIGRGDVFSREAEVRTNRNLTRLSPYRFITIDPYLNDDQDSIYNYNIFLTQYRNKWIFDTGGNLFFSVLNSSTITNQDLLGFSGSLGWENRNFSNRAIAHRFGLEGSYEVEIPSLRPNTVSLQLRNSFELPGIVDILNTGPFLNRIGLLTDRSFNNLNYDGTTKLDFSVGLTNILGFYSLNTVELSWAYNFQPDPYARYTFKQIGLNILDTRKEDAFEEILSTNPLLQRSFEGYLLSGLLFKELSIYRRTRETEGQSYWAFVSSLESSGLENFAINSLVNLFRPNNKSRWTVAGLEVAQYVRLENDIRYYKQVRPRSSFAARFNVGIGIPYGIPSESGAVEVIPYIRQFFVGGPNSIRGWQLRELGPGSYQHVPNTENEPFFQAADFKLEMNTEYRFDLFYVFEGAVFADAGNVWTLANDETRPGSKFASRFLSEMAVSAGWGLRLDFDYFLFRFDFGYKVRSPFADEEGRHWFVNDNGVLGNINFAINYPF